MATISSDEPCNVQRHKGLSFAFVGRADAISDASDKKSREDFLGNLNSKIFRNKEEQIIETQDKPQCLVAAKATLTLTIPGCN